MVGGSASVQYTRLLGVGDMDGMIASAQEPVSLAQAHEWKQLAQKWQARAIKAEGMLVDDEH